MHSSAAYLHFIDHEQIFSFSMSLTFSAGIHVPFNTHLLFTPVPWPPPFPFKCVADELRRSPYYHITGTGLCRQVWTKPWDERTESTVDPRSPEQKDRPYSRAFFEISDMESEMEWQTACDEDPNLDILELYGHPEIWTATREIVYETQVDVRIKPPGGWW
ncbi:hypothetical protein ONZ45_g12399 [Pleurotus djamor]|nr:hypothetical protein ONZ45_g12399 [Pleurotus djamor]